MTKHFCGFVAVLGAPNVGKSTLLNHLIGYKVSIVSAKPNTTRHQIYGIFSSDNAQVILVDTPGIILKPKGMLQRYMIKTAWSHARKTDLALVLVDASRPQHAITDRILTDLQEKNIPVFLILNKVDLVVKQTLLPLASRYQRFTNIQKTFMISGLKDKGIDLLKESLLETMPEREFAFEPDAITQISQKFMAEETTREKIFECFYQEVPYEVHVETENWYIPGVTEPPLGLKLPLEGLSIFQTIFVKKQGHKKIIIGQKGEGLKKIGTRARIQLAQQLDQPVHLFLHVKVVPDWAEKTSLYSSFEE